MQSNIRSTIASILGIKPKVTTVVSETDYKKIGTKEFFRVCVWSVSYVYRLDKVKTVLYIFFSSTSGLFDIAYTFVLAKSIDMILSISSGNSIPFVTSIYHVLLILVVLFATQTVFQAISGYIGNALRVTLRPKISRSFYTKLYSLGIQTLEDPKINNQITRADDNLPSIFSFVDDVIAEISDIIGLIGSSIALIAFSPILIGAIALIHIPYVLWDRRYRGLMYQYSYENTEGFRTAGWNRGSLSSSVSLHEISETSAFGYLDRKFKQFYDTYHKKWYKIIQKWRLGNSSFGFLTDFALVYGYYKIFSQLAANAITVGSATFYFRIMHMVQRGVSDVFRGLNDLTEFALRIKDTYSLFQVKPLVPDGSLPFPKLEKGPNLELKNLTFTYPSSEKIVLKDINLSIKSGEKIAIVGHNGAGKTTLVKILCRLYKPNEGVVLANGIDLSTLKIESWYRNMGVLFQDYNTYGHLTVRENIYMGNTQEPLDETAIRLAAQSADALSFIEEFPNKFDQILSEKFTGGIRPSTGQWQKLAIARFFYRNAPLVIFDEPTASIDAVSEFNIFNRIYEFFNNKTVIIISHRFSTVRNADRIVVLDHGEIVEDGDHNTLMSKGGYYAKAFNLQAKGYSNDNS